MSLSSSALVTLEEIKGYLKTPNNANGRDEALEAIANRASDIVSDYLDRKLVNTATMTEYHSFETPNGASIRSRDLSLREWPAITVTTVHEDTAWPKTYGASQLLVADTDYILSKPTGILHRINTSGPRQWAIGQRAIKVVYTAGYTQATVPERIKAITLRLSALMWSEIDRGAFGISSMSNQEGNWTRFSVARLTDDMKADISSECRNRYFETGEVDA